MCFAFVDNLLNKASIRFELMYDFATLSFWHCTFNLLYWPLNVNKLAKIKDLRKPVLQIYAYHYLML